MIRTIPLTAIAVLALAACQQALQPVEPDPEAARTTLQPSDPYATMDVAVHGGDFVEIQQFTTPGGVSVWLVTEPSIPILSLQMS
ncbi:MAG: hypothetical protein AAFQ18_09605 [Pseudomonadota bacterium]